MVCNCKQVSYNDIADALYQQSKFENVLSAFEDVQKVTHCSTGCGGCHQKVLDFISEIFILYFRTMINQFFRCETVPLGILPMVL